MEFEYNVERKDKECTLSLSGRLDTLSAANLEPTVKEILSEDPKKLTVDITNLEYISSSGLRCFVELFKGCKKAGAEMTILGMQPAIREIFDLTGFTKVFGLK